MVDLLLWNNGNDMHFALVPSTERVQNLNKGVKEVRFWQQCNVAHA
jgi:hypothetical protein